MRSSRFENKTALVTGGGGGFGREISLLFGGEGAQVAVVDVNAGAARRRSTG